MAFVPFTPADIASDLFWPRLQEKLAEIWELGDIPGSPPVLPLYDKHIGYRLRKLNQAFVDIWAEIPSLDGTDVPNIKMFYHSPTIRLLMFNQALELAYTGAAAPRRVVLISGGPPPLIVGQPYNWTYSAVATDASDVNTVVDAVGLAWLASHGVTHDGDAHTFSSDEVLA